MRQHGVILMVGLVALSCAGSTNNAPPTHDLKADAVVTAPAEIPVMRITRLPNSRPLSVDCGWLAYNEAVRAKMLAADPEGGQSETGFRLPRSKSEELISVEQPEHVYAAYLCEIVSVDSDECDGAFAQALELVEVLEDGRLWSLWRSKPVLSYGNDNCGLPDDSYANLEAGDFNKDGEIDLYFSRVSIPEKRAQATIRTLDGTHYIAELSSNGTKAELVKELCSTSRDVLTYRILDSAGQQMAEGSFDSSAITSNMPSQFRAYLTDRFESSKECPPPADF